GSAAGPGCSAGAAGAGLPALERTALVLGHTAPDTRVLSGLDGPLQAGVDHFAPAADLLGLLDLGDRGAGVADREEELWILVQAGCAVAPVHRGRSPCGVGGSCVSGSEACSTPRTRLQDTVHLPNGIGGRGCSRGVSWVT